MLLKNKKKALLMNGYSTPITVPGTARLLVRLLHWREHTHTGFELGSKQHIEIHEINLNSVGTSTTKSYRASCTSTLDSLQKRQMGWYYRENEDIVQTREHALNFWTNCISVVLHLACWVHGRPTIRLEQTRGPTRKENWLHSHTVNYNRLQIHISSHKKQAFSQL